MDAKGRVEKFLEVGVQAFLPQNGRRAASRLLAVALAVGASAAVDVSRAAYAAPGSEPAAAAPAAGLGGMIANSVSRTRQVGGAVGTPQKDADRSPGLVGGSGRQPARAVDGNAGRRSGAGAPTEIRQELPRQLHGATPARPAGAQDVVPGSRKARAALAGRPFDDIDYSGRSYEAGAGGANPSWGRVAPANVLSDLPLEMRGTTYGGRQPPAPRLDREAGLYAFGDPGRMVHLGKDVVENVFAASNVVGTDPALTMALSWRSSQAAEDGILPNTGVKVSGMYAYSEQRFLEELLRWGGSLGLQDLTSAIRRTSEGALVPVGNARDMIDDLRTDVHAGALIGAANVKSAQAMLAQSAPGAANAADVLVAVQFGDDVALNLVKARLTNPHLVMRGPLADVVAGLGLPSTDPDGRFWTVTSFNRAADAQIRDEARTFAPMRAMTLAPQHRAVAGEEPAMRGASYYARP